MPSFPKKKRFSDALASATATAEKLATGAVYSLPHLQCKGVVCSLPNGNALIIISVKTLSNRAVRGCLVDEKVWIWIL